MTNQQGAPEALRLADDLEASSLFPGNMRSCNNAAAAELRRLHAHVAALTAATEVQAEPGKDEATCQMCGEKPHPGCNSEFQDEAACRFYHPATAQTALTVVAPTKAQIVEGLRAVQSSIGWRRPHILDQPERTHWDYIDAACAALVEAQQPSPSTAAARSLTDGQRALHEAILNRLSHAELLEKAHYLMELNSNQACTIGELQDLVEAAPQPSPTPQADSQPAPVAGGYPAPPGREVPSYSRDGLRLVRDSELRAYVDADRAARAADSVTAPAGGGVAGMSETVQFSDKSKAPPLEKARRYLKAMGDQRTNSAYFFDDGYPRRESAQDALATLAVLEQLAATPQPTQAQAGAVPLTNARLQDISLEYSDSEDECTGFRDGWRAAEKHFGIKGGQHG